VFKRYSKVTCLHVIILHCDAIARYRDCVCLRSTKFIRLAHCKCKSLMFWLPRLSVSRLISKTKRGIDAKFRHFCRKSGSPSKNMTSGFPPEVAKYPKSSRKHQNSSKWCASVLLAICRPRDFTVARPALSSSLAAASVIALR